MRVLVTGAAGFIGSHTINLLEKHHHEVLAVDNFSTGKTENLKGFRGQICPCDVIDAKLMEKEFAEFKPHAVIHLAAQSAISTAFLDPKLDLRVNGIGTLNMLKLSQEFGVNRFVFASTSAVYKNQSFLSTRETSELSPNTPYGISKLAAEYYIRLFFNNHTILRYANVYGPRQTPIGDNQLIARAFRHFLHGDDFTITGHGKQKRDFVYVEDIASCNVMAVEAGATGTFNVASGSSYSVNDVLAVIEGIYEVKGYRWEHTRNEDPRKSVYLNAGLIRKTMGWRAYTSLEDGLKLTNQWWEDHK